MSDQGFEEFFRDHHLSLFRALYLLTGDAREAEDVLQDAFLRVWRRWDRVARMDRPVGYLYRTAMNEFRRRARRRAPRSRGGNIPPPRAVLKTASSRGSWPH